MMQAAEAAADITLRQHVERWLAEDAALARILARVDAPAYRRKADPALIVAATTTSDWSGKGFAGRELELALTLTMRGADEARFSKALAAIETRMASVPDNFPGGKIITLIPLRRRQALTSDGVWRARAGYRARFIIN